MSAQINTNSLICEACSAQLERTSNGMAIVCAYCGNSNVVTQNGDVETERPVSEESKCYAIPMELTLEDLEYQLYCELARHQSGRSDLMEKARIVTREMLYVPVYASTLNVASGSDAATFRYGGTQLKNAPMNPLSLITDILGKGTCEELSSVQSLEIDGCLVEDFSARGWDDMIGFKLPVQCYVPLCHAVFTYRNQHYHLWMSGIKYGACLISPLPAGVSKREAIFGPYMAATIAGLMNALFSAASAQIEWVGAGMTLLTFALAVINHNWRNRGFPAQRRSALARAETYFQQRRQSEAGADAQLFQVAPFKRPPLLLENVPTGLWFVIGVVEMIVSMLIASYTAN